MINNIESLKKFIEKDLGIYRSSFFELIYIIKEKLKGNHDVVKHEILYSLRKYEYYLNANKIGMRKWFWHFIFRNRQFVHDIYISPNSIDEGCTIMHPGFRRVASYCKIGKGVTLLPMILIGKKKPGMKVEVVIGDNCYISTGVTILGPCRIGNNVTIGAGAVVTRDVPDDVTIGGIPASIIKAHK